MVESPTVLEVSTMMVEILDRPPLKVEFYTSLRYSACVNRALDMAEKMCGSG